MRLYIMELGTTSCTSKDRQTLVNTRHHHDTTLLLLFDIKSFIGFKCVAKWIIIVIEDKISRCMQCVSMG